MKKFSAFPIYAQDCGWNALLEAQQHSDALTTDTTCDVVVIGAGYTGIAAARRTAELLPSGDIVLLDSSSIGEGNPGRNSGFLLEVALAHDVDAQNMQRMRRCNELLQQTMESLRDDAAASGIDCQLQRSGTYRAAAGKPGSKALERYRRFLDTADLPCEVLDRDGLEQRLGTRFYRHGLYSPHCYLAQPAALIRALATLLPATVRLYEKTPALRIEPDTGRWLVSTPQGQVAAPKVIIANNAFCKGLGWGAERIVAMYTYAALTEPLAEAQLRQCGSDNEWGVLPAHRLGSTLRRTADGRLLIRSLYGYEREADNQRIAGQLQQALRRRFPQLGDLTFAAVWAGATGFTYNASPLWGELRPGLYISAGCNGGGVVKGTLFGRSLAELALGHDTLDINALFGSARRMPPEPLRWLGFKLISAIERYRGRAEV